MLLKKGFRFRLDPTDSQRQLFAQFAGASRFLYNRGLEQRKQTIEIPDPIPALISEEKAVGIDMGLKSFATTASGPHNTAEHIDNPRFFTQYLPRLRVLSQRLSKKVKGSRNWLKAKLQLSKLHARIRHCREDFAHQLSTEIVKSHDIICVEGLDIANLLQTGTRDY